MNAAAVAVVVADSREDTRVAKRGDREIVEESVLTPSKSVHESVSSSLLSLATSVVYQRRCAVERED